MTPQMVFMTPHLKKLTGTLQYFFFLCNAYHMEPTVGFLELLVVNEGVLFASRITQIPLNSILLKITKLK